MKLYDGGIVFLMLVGLFAGVLNALKFDGSTITHDSAAMVQED